ncbi:unnamed protein product [Caenorhabditis bovis]|uniref:T20D4.11-like domain-containing protein n=1 Tax=Caenorhabditis bovis TaxID=2654633 RepID=A0A8S1EXS3_9PELO|nr:unnamed protein product [Caenorhabditis bovis]
MLIVVVVLLISAISSNFAEIASFHEEFDGQLDRCTPKQFQFVIACIERTFVYLRELKTLSASNKSAVLIYERTHELMNEDCQQIAKCFEQVKCADMKPLAENFEKACNKPTKLPLVPCLAKLHPILKNETACDGYFQKRKISREEKCAHFEEHRECVVDYYKKQCGELLVDEEINKERSEILDFVNCNSTDSIF